MLKSKDSRTFDFAAASHPGVVRTENEDYSSVFECINGSVFIVCDGMGGKATGALASKSAVDSIQAYLENHYFDMPEDALKAAIEYANSVVYRKSRENAEYQGMGTTIVMAMVRNDKFHYAHVGDSRLYIFSEGKLHRLTRDHSQVQNLIDKGLLSEAEAKNHPQRNIITRALGVGLNIEIEFCSSPAVPALNDYMILCTDGLFNMLDDAEIGQVLMEGISNQEKADKLIRLANEKGGTDNITVQLACFDNVTTKKSKFVSLFQIPGAIRPQAPVEDKPVQSDDEINTDVSVDTKTDFQEEENKPEQIPEDSFEQEPVPVEPDDEPFVTESVEEPEPAETVEESVHVEPVTEQAKAEPVQDFEQPKPLPGASQQDGKQTPEVSFFNRFNFFSKLKETSNKKAKIRIILIILGTVFIAYVLWDLFIKQSAPTIINDKTPAVMDSTAKGDNDTMTANAKDQTQPVAPVPTGKDTIWISYSVKKGEFLGTIASKFGITVDYIKSKNKLASDNIREKQKLDIPTKANHKVAAGETADAIAKKYKVDKKRILKANDISDEKSIRAGNSLIIPYK